MMIPVSLYASQSPHEFERISKDRFVSHEYLQTANASTSFVLTLE